MLPSSLRRIMSLIKIENDIFFLAERLREIDPDYFIALNTKSKNFEVHNLSQPINSFCLLVPKNKLDPSLVEYVRKTRANRQKKLLAEIEAANQKMQKQNEQKIICEAAEKFEELTKNSRS